MVQLGFISWGDPRKPVTVHGRLPAEQATGAQRRRRRRRQSRTRYVGSPRAGQKEREPARARVHHGWPVSAGRARRLGSAVKKRVEGKKKTKPTTTTTTLTQTSQLSQDEWKGELSSLQHGLIKTTLQPFYLVGNHISSTVLANRLYPSGRGYLGDYELCHMNMTLKANWSTLSSMWAGFSREIRRDSFTHQICSENRFLVSVEF